MQKYGIDHKNNLKPSYTANGVVSSIIDGKTIIDKDDGKGVIKDVEKKGEMRILKIKFENSSTKRKPLNTERMTIEEEK